MQSITLPNFPRLQGKEAIEALNNFIQEVEEKRNKELTKKQTKVLKKFAKGLIASIEAEQNSESQKKEMGFFARLRESVKQRSQNTGRA